MRFIAAASTSISLKATLGCALETSLQTCANRPSLFLRTLDLWTATTLRAPPLCSAISKAYLAILSEANLVMVLQGDDASFELELLSLVEVLGVLPDDDQVYPGLERGDAGEALRRPDVRVEVEHLPELDYHVGGGLAHRGLEAGV